MAKVSSNRSAIQTMTVIYFFLLRIVFFGLKITEIPLWKDVSLYLRTNTDIFPALLEIGVVLDKRAVCVEGVGWYRKMCSRSITSVSPREALLLRVPGNGEVSTNKTPTLELPQNNLFHFISRSASEGVCVCICECV